MPQQILKNTVGHLRIDPPFSKNQATGPVTVTVRKADGTTLVTGTATMGTGNPPPYLFDLAPVAELDSLTVTWSGTWDGQPQSGDTYTDIVGGLLFTIAQARAFGDKVLADTAKYPDDAISDTRDRITD